MKIKDAKGQVSLDRIWEKRKDLIMKYYRENPKGEENTAMEMTKRVKEGCKWCARLKEAGFRHCLHCGTVFK